MIGDCGSCRHWQQAGRETPRCGKHWWITLLLDLGRKGYRVDCHDFEPVETPRGNADG